jgi:hypothetical protein
MSERRVLVIGSQCKALQRLDFLPRAAQDLHAVMTDRERGACVSAIDGDGLLIDPTVKDAKDAIRTAYQRAARDGAKLFIAYIGHGEHVRNRYYLLPRDAEVPPTADTAVHLTNLIMETHDTAAGQVDGLAVLVDACYAGLAGFGAAQAWVSDLEGTLRFEMLTAAANRPAADGCFSRTLATLLRDGISAVPAEHLRCIDLRSRLEQSCPNQVPQHPAYNPDEALWLVKNAGRIREPWAHTPTADQVQRLTIAYQVTPDLGEVVARSQAERCVAVLGEAGRGKSALSAALAWPDIARGTVPTGFVQAVAFLTEATTSQELARLLAEQLVRSVPRFAEAQLAFTRETPYAEQQRLGSLERQVVGPLGRLAPESRVRIVIDGLERIATGARNAVMDALNAMTNFQSLRLIVTARPDTELPEAASNSYLLDPTPAEKVVRYLEQRSVAQARRQEIITAAEGNWLVVRVLADLMNEDPDAEVRTGGRLALGDAYAELLSRCGANDNTWLVLSLMAAAGAGPVLPLRLLCAASEKLGGLATEAGLRNELFRLRGLVARTGAGTEREHAGLFHQTLLEYVFDRGSQEAMAAHRALADCIQVLAPAGAGSVDLNDPIQRYAFEREAEHLWALEDRAALKSLSARAAVAPRDNLRRWRLWESRVENRFGASHQNTLATRSNIALWIGQCGDAREALRLFQALLPDQVRVLGTDHPDTLTTRGHIAFWTGQCGDAREALRLFQALSPDLERVLGADHTSALIARANIAFWTGRSGDAREARRLYEALLPDQVRVLRADRPDTLTTRANIALWTGQCGDAREALRLFQALLPDQVRVLGGDYPETLTTRANIAFWTGQDGDAREALRLYKALLPDGERILGADHPETLIARANIAFWTGKSGDAREALRLYEALLPDRERVLGADHPETLTARGNIAHLVGQQCLCLAPITPTRSPRAATSRPGAARTATRARRCNCTRRCCPTGSAFSAPITPTRSPLAPTSPSGLANPATRARRCDCTRHCCPTRCGCLAPITPTRSPRAATSRPGAARTATRARRCNCTRRCCPTKCGCLAPITPARSPRAATSRPGPASATTRARRCDCSRRCCPIESAFSAPITPTRCQRAPTSPIGPASPAMRPRRCDCMRRCCPTNCGCLAPITPTRSRRATGFRI